MDACDSPLSPWRQPPQGPGATKKKGPDGSTFRASGIRCVRRNSTERVRVARTAMPGRKQLRRNNTPCTQTGRSCTTCKRAAEACQGSEVRKAGTAGTAGRVGKVGRVRRVGK